MWSSPFTNHLRKMNLSILGERERERCRCKKLIFHPYNIICPSPNKYDLTTQAKPILAL